MARAETNPEVDAFFAQERPWREEMRALRKIALGCGMQEQMKWGWPSYASAGKNVVLIHAFKDYCALLFFKGALLKDSDRLLIQQTDNVQSGRQLRFASLREVTDRGSAVKAYIEEAIEIERAGLKVAKKTTADFPLAQEFEEKLREQPHLKSAFEALTPGRQRAYLLHFAGAKQSKTRAARVEACAPRILAGKGLDD